MSKIFGFIGCGNMGGALAKAVAKTVGGESVVLCDNDNNKAQALACEIGGKTADLASVAKECDYIFIGVKPQVIKNVLGEIAPHLKDNKKATLVSMAAGVSIDSVKEYAGGFENIIRIMPNTPVAIGKGVVLYSTYGEVNETEFCESMQGAGVLDQIDEKLIDAASALSGCGPAFVYEFIEALSDGAVACGLPRDKAILYASKTLEGAAELVVSSKKHPGQLKDEVCSPGGSTIEGVKALEEGAFRGVAMNAVVSAFERTKELGRK